MSSDNTGVLEALLTVSSDERSIHGISEELNLYYDTLVGVLIETTQSVSPDKLKSNKMFNLALKCLINFSSDELRAKKIYVTCSPLRRQQLLFCLVGTIYSDADAEIKFLCTSLLINLTQIKEWLEELCDSTHAEIIFDKIVGNLMPSSTDLQLLLNLTLSSKMRRHICKNAKCLTTLLDSEGCMGDLSKRTSVIGVIKNCCFEDEFHADLCCNADSLFSKVLLRLCGPEDKLSFEDIQSLCPALRSVYGTEKAFREPDSIIKKTICEALLQLCSTPIGRSHLRSLGAYFVLRELHTFECMREKRLLSEIEEGFGSGRALQTVRSLIFIIEQVVDQLICLENERPTEYQSTSLRNIPVDKTTQRDLESAKKEFVSS
uniref:Protein HGH1 homolog n=2 Tax=Schistocephalus solidus TaxID=70667 RepID=A0A0X3P9I2_SCHSO